MSWNPANQVLEVEDGVFHVVGPASNWVVLVENGQPALIDCGYPRDDRPVLASLRYLGFPPSAVVGIAATHGHSDHIGLAHKFQDRFATRVIATEAEAANVTRSIVDQVAVSTVVKNAWKPRVAAWLAHAVRSGGTDAVAVEDVERAVPDEPVDLPRHPVPVSVPGHTRGHTCYVIEDRGVLVSGDALVTGHSTMHDTGPALLPEMFHYDQAEANRNLDMLAELDTRWVLPGHGCPFHGGVMNAVDRARTAADD